jgi:hypothetical protein
MSVGTTTISGLHYDKTTMLWHNRGHDFELRDNSYEHTVKIAISTTQPCSDKSQLERVEECRKAKGLTREKRQGCPSSTHG